MLLKGVTLPHWVFCVLPCTHGTSPAVTWLTPFPSATGNRCSYHEKKQLMASNIVSGWQFQRGALLYEHKNGVRMRMWLQTDCAALPWISMYCYCTVQVVWASVPLLSSLYSHCIPPYAHRFGKIIVFLFHCFMSCVTHAVLAWCWFKWFRFQLSACPAPELVQLIWKHRSFTTFFGGGRGKVWQISTMHMVWKKWAFDT